MLYKILLLFIFVVSVFSAHAQPSSIRILLVGDPFALAFRNIVPELQDKFGVVIELEIVGYNAMRELTIANANDVISSYDIVSFDVVWLGEYVSQDILLPLNNYIEESPELEVDDFLVSAYIASRNNSVQYGLPIQPHPEILWYRTDLFAEAGLDAPVTTDDVLNAAATLHNTKENLAGICWNAQQGQALGQQMSHFYAAFGQPLLDDDLQPLIDSPQGLTAAQYALKLMEYSPPDILNMAWDQRIRRFSEGGCAMTYAWGARISLIEALNPELMTNIGYVAAPHAVDQAPVTPLGVWSLGIPANIGEREAIAWEFLANISSAQVQEDLIVAGNGGVPRLSLASDRDLVEMYPIFSLIADLEKRNQLQDWMRPAIPEWATIADIMGLYFHNMLRGDISADEAVLTIQEEVTTLMNP